MACQLRSKAPQSGVKFSIFLGDDDSTDIKTKFPMVLKKWSDIVHTKQALNSRLYKVRPFQRIKLLSSESQSYKKFD